MGARGLLYNDHRIVAISVWALHVFVSVPVVFPLVAVDKVPKLIFLSRFKIKRDFEIATFQFFHRGGIDVPIVELADNAD